MMRRIFNPGFHKDLLTEIEIMLTTSILPNVCTLVIEENLRITSVKLPVHMRYHKPAKPSESIPSS